MGHRALEAASGDVNAAAAGDLFAHEATLALPHGAFDELFSLSTDDEVPDWSRRWLVDAPRFQEEALTMRLMVRLDGVESGTWKTMDRSIGARYPESWGQEIVGLNDLQVLETHLELGRPAIASERDIRRETATLNLVPFVIHNTPALHDEYVRRYRPDLSTRRALLAEFAARSEVKVELERLRTEWLARDLRLVREARAEAFKSDAIVAPIGADPVRESREQFEARARYHWDARVARARQMGFVPVTPRPAMELHVRWLVRYQIRREAFAEIARKSRPVSTGPAVAAAVRSMAILIGLTLRPAVRGGRRPRPSQRVQRKN